MPPGAGKHIIALLRLKHNRAGPDSGMYGKDSRDRGRSTRYAAPGLDAARSGSMARPPCADQPLRQAPA